MRVVYAPAHQFTHNAISPSSQCKPSDNHIAMLQDVYSSLKKGSGKDVCCICISTHHEPIYQQLKYLEVGTNQWYTTSFSLHPFLFPVDHQVMKFVSAKPLESMFGSVNMASPFTFTCPWKQLRQSKLTQWCVICLLSRIILGCDMCK